MTGVPFKIKTISRKEVDIAVAWAAAEGWNPGLHDADSYYTADPNGFLIGYLGKEPIASISVVKYDESFGFLGFYIVKPEYRGQGYGIQIWKAGLDYLAGCNVGLDGVVNQQENYKKSGFNLAYRNVRYEGTGGGEAADNESIVDLGSVPFVELVEYERPFFPTDRSSFLKSWIAQPNSHALGIMSNDQLAGYGVIRQCRSGYKIGPLYANSPDLADTLFQALRSKVSSAATIYLDVPEPNSAAVTLAQQHGMSIVFETARMYTDDAPNIPLNRVFGVTSFEIG